MNQRELVQLAIRQCTKCDLGVGVTPVPFRSKLARPSVAVIGHGPGHKELDKGVPWVGPSGRLARKLIDESGLHSSDVVYLNVVCCGDKPAQRHIDACRSNWTMQMRACEPRYAIVFGAVATNALLPFTVTLSAIRGHWWKLPTGQWAMSMTHPAQLLYHDAPIVEHQLHTDLHKFAQSVLLEDLNPPKKSEQCLMCWRWAVGYVQEVGFCNQHYPKKLRKNERAEQMSLFTE